MLKTLFACTLVLCPVVGQADTLLGYIGFRADNLLALPRWQRVLNSLPEERQTALACDEDTLNCPHEGMRKWRSLVAEAKELTPWQQIKAVNLFINQWPYITDDKLWGRGDYWETPSEFTQFSGDCEDYAILKYVTLRELGFPAQDLRIVVVQDVVRDIAHAVLVVYFAETDPDTGEKGEKKTYILDSLFTTVLEQGSMLQYKPYYAVNETSRWTYVPPFTGGANTPAGAPFPNPQKGRP